MFLHLTGAFVTCRRVSQRLFSPGLLAAAIGAILLLTGTTRAPSLVPAADTPPRETRTYETRLTLVKTPKALLADHPEFVEPIKEEAHFEAPLLVDDRNADLHVRACERVKKAGGVLHCFAVGRTFEQESVAWLKEVAQAGHPIGNHTYDHVSIRATKPEDIQFRFRRAPWLIDGHTPAAVIRENIRLATAALRTRIGVRPAGFHTPGGFADGLEDRADLRKMVRELGFSWVSSKYPAHPLNEAGKEPTQKVFDGIVRAQSAAQPFVYPDGLIEVPMSPISDIGAFRGGRWKLEWFLKAIRLGVQWAIDNKAVFDFLGHPSCLYVTDPEFKTIDLICGMVKKAGKKAALADLGTLAEPAKK